MTDTPADANDVPRQQGRRRERLREVALLFTRLGFTAFGGPPVHLAMMEEECVNRRRWLDREHFLDIVAAVNFVPGPNSTETAIHMGLIRAGVPGLFVAGFCFITPAVLIILPIAWAYVTFGSLPQVQPALRAINAAVVAIVLMALVRLIRPAWKDPASVAIAASSLVAAFVLQRAFDVQPEVIILAAAAVIGAGLRTAKSSRRVALPMLSLAPGLLQIGAFFLKVGLTMFGSGYVLVSYLQSGLVDQRHWLTQQQVLDSIAVGQFTPGPLLTTATFSGFLLGYSQFKGGYTGGVLGAVVATIGIFLPAFLLILLLAPVLQRVRRSPAARGSLDGMNAAVIGLLSFATIRLAVPAVYDATGHHPDWLGASMLIAALLAAARGVNSAWIVLGAGGVGWLLRMAVT